MQVFPSLISQNPEEIHGHIRLLGPHCAGFHIDIMDGQFVHQRMGSVDLINEISRMTRKQLWIHIIAQNPLKIIKELKPHSGDIITFHATAEYDYQEIITELTNKNVIPSLGLNPSTPITVLNNAIDFIDHVTIMSVEPGQSGQKFIPETLNKIEQVHAFRAAQECRLTIAVDGGINLKNIAKLNRLGINQVAASSAIFNSEDPLEALRELSQISSNDR